MSSSCHHRISSTTCQFSHDFISTQGWIWTSACWLYSRSTSDGYGENLCGELILYIVVVPHCYAGRAVPILHCACAWWMPCPLYTLVIASSNCSACCAIWARYTACLACWYQTIWLAMQSSKCLETLILIIYLSQGFSVVSMDFAGHHSVCFINFKTIAATVLA